MTKEKRSYVIGIAPLIYVYIIIITLNKNKIYNMKKDLLKCTKNIKKVEINRGNTLQ